MPLVGRIVCDSAGQLNAQSIILEGSSRTSKCNRVRLDVSSLPGYSLFPGQVRSCRNSAANSVLISLDCASLWHLHEYGLFPCEALVWRK